MPDKKRPTIIDVARAAQVGASTVSRHVRGGKSVSPRVARVIEAAISQLGYEPNTLARGLRVGRSQILGVLVPHVNNVFFGNALRTIQAEAQQHGFTVMLLTHEEDARLQQKQLASLKRSQVEGIILVPAAGTIASHVNEALGKTPVVALDRSLSTSVDAVTLHNHAAGRQATEHLLWHKHKQVVSITAAHKLNPLRNRLKGHQDAMQLSGRTPETLILQNAGQLRRELQAALQRKRAPATAILSMSYSVTIAVLAALRESSISLSGLAFIGIDDLEFASFLEPSLTTVAQPAEKFAQLAVEQLLRRIAGNTEAPLRIALPGTLIVRSSCGCPRPA
jgi:LacI family transcriptional regulator